jgi:hypothetical protein
MDYCLGNQFELDHSTVFMGVVSELRTFRSISNENEKIVILRVKFGRNFLPFSYELHNNMTKIPSTMI